VAATWKWIRLYGTWWGATNAPEDQIAQARKYKTESEAKLTQLLEEGWTIHSVVPQAPNGLVELWVQPMASFPAVLKQESWTVFLVGG